MKNSAVCLESCVQNRGVSPTAGAQVTYAPLMLRGSWAGPMDGSRGIASAGLLRWSLCVGLWNAEGRQCGLRRCIFSPGCITQHELELLEVSYELVGGSMLGGGGGHDIM